MNWSAALAPLLIIPAVMLTSHQVFSFVDPTITESSGLVDLGGLMVTTNDSGGDPLVFVIDPRTGRTVGRTTFTDEVIDTEALAPAGKSSVWVGDIGDNTEVRSRVQVYKVPVGRGEHRVTAPAYDLVYPDGPHDAESLIAGPDGRLRIISKGVLGGRVYLAPKVLRTDRTNRLVRGPEVGVYATDAALFPDGRHVLVRGYGDAVIATLPEFEPLAVVDLPSQQQGEGVSISRSGRIRLSSEGVHSAVLQVALPARVGALLAPAASTATGTPIGTPAAPTDGGVLIQRGGDPLWLWLLGGTALLSGLGWLALRRRAGG